VNRLALILGFALLVGGLRAAPSQLGSASVWYGQLAASPVLTVSYTVSSGSNTLLIVNAQAQGGFTFTGATYNGVAMTLSTTHSPGSGGPMYVWYLVNPPTGSPYNLALTMNNPYGQYSVIASAFQSVNQSSPIGTTETGTGNFVSAAPCLWTDTMASYSESTSIFQSYQTNNNNPGSMTTNTGTFIGGAVAYQPQPFWAAWQIIATSTSIIWQAQDYYSTNAYYIHTEIKNAGASPTPVPHSSGFERAMGVYPSTGVYGANGVFPVSPVLVP